MSQQFHTKDISNSSFLVTGGAGYIGSHTVLALTAKGYTPVIVDDFRNANEVVLKGLSEILGFEPILHRADICDSSAMKAIFQTYADEK